MRIPTILAGVVLIIGAAFLYFGGEFTRQHSVVDVDGLIVSAKEHHAVQPWIAELMLLGGAALLFRQ